MKKRLLSLFITLAMLISMVPSTILVTGSTTLDLLGITYSADGTAIVGPDNGYDGYRPHPSSAEGPTYTYDQTSSYKLTSEVSYFYSDEDCTVATTTKPGSGYAYYFTITVTDFTPDSTDVNFGNFDPDLCDVTIEGFDVEFVKATEYENGAYVGLTLYFRADHITEPQLMMGSLVLSDGYYLKSGTPITSTTKPSGGYAYYKDGVLELNNYNATYYSSITLRDMEAIEFKLVGENLLTSIRETYSSGNSRKYTDITFTGDGQLTIKNTTGVAAVFTGGDVTVESGTISMKAAQYGISAANLYVGTNSSLEVEGNTAAINPTCKMGLQGVVAFVSETDYILGINPDLEGYTRVEFVPISFEITDFDLPEYGAYLDYDVTLTVVAENGVEITVNESDLSMTVGWYHSNENHENLDFISDKKYLATPDNGYYRLRLRMYASNSFELNSDIPVTINGQPAHSIVADSTMISANFYCDVFQATQGKTITLDNVLINDGDYLASGASKVTATKPSGGYAYYKDGVLYLNNYDCPDATLKVAEQNGFILDVTGTNKLYRIEDDGESYTTFVFEGSGSLTVDYEGSGSLCTLGDVYFNSGSYTFNSTGWGILAGTLTVNGGSVNVAAGSDYAANATEYYVYDGKLVLDCPTGTAIDSDDVIASGRVVIDKDGELWDGETDLNSYSYLNITKGTRFLESISIHAEGKLTGNDTHSLSSIEINWIEEDAQFVFDRNTDSIVGDIAVSTDYMFYFDKDLRRYVSHDSSLISGKVYYTKIYIQGSNLDLSKFDPEQCEFKIYKSSSYPSFDCPFEVEYFSHEEEVINDIVYLEITLALIYDHQQTLSLSGKCLNRPSFFTVELYKRGTNTLVDSFSNYPGNIFKSYAFYDIAPGVYTIKAYGDGCKDYTDTIAIGYNTEYDINFEPYEGEAVLSGLSFEGSIGLHSNKMIIIEDSYSIEFSSGTAYYSYAFDYMYTDEAMTNPLTKLPQDGITYYCYFKMFDYSETRQNYIDFSQIGIEDISITVEGYVIKAQRIEQLADGKGINVYLTIECEGSEESVSVTPAGDIDYVVEGNVVTVDYDVACKLGYLSGDEYVPVTPTANGDGTYSYTLPSDVTDVILVVTGDVNGDGQVTKADSTKIKAAFNNKITLSAAELFAANVNGDDEITKADSTRAKAVFNGKASFDW